MISSGDGVKLPHLCEEVLDKVLFLMDVPVVVARDAAVGLGRDHDRLPGCFQRFDHAFVGIKCLSAISMSAFI